MKEYAVLCESSVEILERTVDRYLEAGWELQGGVAVDSNDCLFQAIAREKPDPGEG